MNNAGATRLLSLSAALPRYSSNPGQPGRPLTYFDDTGQSGAPLTEALRRTEASPTTGLLEALPQNSRTCSPRRSGGPRLSP